MLEIHHITSFDAPALQPYRTMRLQHDHREQGIFVAEGEKVVRRLLESHFGVVSIVLPNKWLDRYQALLEARKETIQVFLAEKALLETLTGYSMYQGLLAVGKIPKPPTLDEVLAGRPAPHLLMAADGLSSAENLGALVRNCAAFDATALLTSESCSSPFVRRAVRSSMGTIFRLPIIERLPLAGTLATLRARGVRCLAADAHGQAATLAETSLRGDICVVLGSEGAGLSAEVLAACDERVHIPMAWGIDSLNVASAAGIFLYEARRQRKASSGTAAAG